jgi:hypothetical protein
MKTSCLSDPKNEKLMLIHQWQLDFCGGNHCAAALLQDFRYWHDRNIEDLEKGDREHLWQWHTEEQLRTHLLGLYSHESIRAGIRLLAQKGIIEIGANPNKRKNYDRTRWFLFKPEVADEFLAMRDLQQTRKIASHDPRKIADVNKRGKSRLTCARVDKSETTTERDETSSSSPDFAIAQVTEEEKIEQALKDKDPGINVQHEMEKIKAWHKKRNRRLTLGGVQKYWIPNIEPETVQKYEYDTEEKRNARVQAQIDGTWDEDWDERWERSRLTTEQ